MIAEVLYQLYIEPVPLSRLTFNLFIVAVMSAAQQSENLCEMRKGFRHLDEGTGEGRYEWG